MADARINPDAAHPPGAHPNAAAGHPLIPPPPIKRHPPTSPGPVERTYEGRVWPNLVGIAVVVLQGLGLLVSLAYALSLLIDYEKLFGNFAPAQTFAATEQWKPHLFASYATAALLAVLAIVGGSFVLLRRRLGVRLLIVWSVLRLPYAVWASWVNALVQRDTASAMGGLTIGPTAPPNMLGMMFWITLAMGITVALALPLFLLIWFHVPRIRRQVRVWH